MWNLLDCFVICTRFRVMNFVKDFRKDERGVSVFTVFILLIVIFVLIVLLCVLFWNKIFEWFGQQFCTMGPLPEIS